MKIEFVIANPTGNITLLILSPVPVEDQPRVAEILMGKYPMAEQTGFISPGDTDTDISLRMAGGEFCGNATMSAAVFFTSTESCSVGDKKTVKVRTSGASEPVTVYVECISATEFRGTVDMPHPTRIVEADMSFGGHRHSVTWVDLEGITHLVTEDRFEKQEAEEAIKTWCSEAGISALGLMQVDVAGSEVKPLVYVTDPPTLFWESSCASGTTAVGAYLAHLRRERIRFEAKEPGGTLIIEAEPKGKLLLSGTVELSQVMNEELD